jgi:hypothetical protein
MSSSGIQEAVRPYTRPALMFKYPVTSTVVVDHKTGRALCGSYMIDRRTGEQVTWHKRPKDFTAEDEGWVDWRDLDAAAEMQARGEGSPKGSDPWSRFCE